MTRTVSDVARVAGVTVRTLHHYDEIGLLSPAERSDAGYRLYDDRDLQRLQEILFYRELGFPLEEIAGLLDEPGHDRGDTLRRQHELLQNRRRHLDRMLRALEHALEAHERGVTMSEDDMFEVFGGFDPKVHRGEAEERWPGNLMEESKRRTGSYSKDQWKAIMAEGEDIARRFASALGEGLDPTGAEAQAIAEVHRLHIDRWYYPCSFEVHAGLGDLYVEDGRFAAYWNDHAADLAPYVRTAIHANAGMGWA